MTRSDPLEKLQKCLEAVRSRTDFRPRAALVLGSGLGAFADEINAVAAVDYADIPEFPRSTVQGHRGRFVFGEIGGTPTVVMQGSVHYYEGYGVSDVVLPIRLMGLLGAETLILTNASGGINPLFSAGDLCLIDDHILYGVPSPLIGANIDALGTRFPDMSAVYDADLRAKTLDIASRLDIPLQRGVYIQTSGPQFETPSEIRAFGALGADIVGMSTAVEAVAARHMGLRVLGVSCVSNKAAGLNAEPLTHEEVQAAADKCAPRFKSLLRAVIGEL
ncbi:MAG: purine-nucleoside phosphorylase [Oscillospiraceae bacterium]|jgi:purine-nucleoside phosphorylase|nr:purine-nucleoside phosphorylase [Oscillospiraceae bacterium]